MIFFSAMIQQVKLNKGRKMIKVYYRGSCGSSRRAFAWFEKYNITIQKQQISKITRSDLIKLLQHSDEGLKSIVKR